jgi:hypothetical protein
MEAPNPPTHSARWGMRLPTRSSYFALAIIIANISPTILKSIGDRGFPALDLFSFGNND